MDDSLPKFDFAEAKTSLNWDSARVLLQKLFTAFGERSSPVGQYKLDNDDLSTSSNQQTPELITPNHLLKMSRSPGRNINNESVFCDDEYADYSYLALAYPLIGDPESSLDEGYRPTSTSLVSGIPGYLADDSFSFFETYSCSSSLTSNDSSADVSCSSFQGFQRFTDSDGG